MPKYEKCSFCDLNYIEKCIKYGFDITEKCTIIELNSSEKCARGEIMLYRKIQKKIEEYFALGSNKIMIIDGARQVGKTYIVRHVGREMFANYIEIDLLEDSVGRRLFENTRTVEDFYLQVSMIAGDKMNEKKDTLIFLDEIQAYPHLLTMLKFLKEDDRYTYIASGSLLGVTLSKTTSIPMGSIQVIRMYPLDFEEFLYANKVGQTAVTALRQKFMNKESLDEATHGRVMDLFKKYLLAGGLPDAVVSYGETNNIVKVRDIQREIHEYYAMDAGKYDETDRLKIRRIYDMIPSTLENKKKRIIVKDIEHKKGRRYADYQDEFDYLINAGIALEVHAISTPAFPLIESSGKNLLKLYLNDVGILTCILYNNNIRAVLDDNKSVDLGTVYESVVASELAAHGHRLFYYDNRTKGEVDFLIDDHDSMSVLPIEVKSGKDYTIHSALDTFISNKDYAVSKGIVLSNEREVSRRKDVIYMPIYYAMFL